MLKKRREQPQRRGAASAGARLPPATPRPPPLPRGEPRRGPPPSRRITPLKDPVELIEDIVPAGEQVHIYHAVEGTGGHAMPTNFFGDFQVLSGNTIIYPGVVNDDWQEEDLGLVLVIEAKVAAPEAVDYSCGEASDCQVKDVGNYCGYYPRCVNVDSPTPART